MKNEKVIIFTGPSGVGKATIEKKLFSDKELNLELSISATTRKKRINEEEGKHYYFISNVEFEEKIKNNNFIEWSGHFSNKYGTLLSEINRIIEKGRIPFLEVETNGAKNIIEKYGNEKLISIFLMPPSFAELEKRVRERNTDSEEQIQQRLKRYQEEIQHANIFQHVVVNRNVEETYLEIKKIIKGSI